MNLPPYGKLYGCLFEQACALGSTEGLVFACMATHSSGATGGGIWVSQETIARKIRKSVRSVTYAVARLSESGLIQRDGHYARGIVRWRIPGPQPIAELDSGDSSDQQPIADLEVGQVSNPLRTSAKSSSQVRKNQHPGPQPIADKQNLTEEEQKYMGSGEAPHVASRCDSGDQEAPSGRQEAAPPPAVEEASPAWGRSSYAEADSRAAAEEALIAERRAKWDRDFHEDCIRDEAQALADFGIYATLPPPARLPALVALTRAYRARWPRSWPSAWTQHAAALNGAITNKPAFVTAHLEGYARADWIPENKPEPERFDHLLLLKGDPSAWPQNHPHPPGHQPHNHNPPASYKSTLLDFQRTRT